jgi:F-type H+-transporting ATPase subunit delta
VARTSIRALRFAEAAFAVARDSNAIDAWLAALEQASLIFDNHAAAIFLSSPVEAADKKTAVLDELLPSMAPAVRNFLAILTHRDRLDLIPQITVTFRRLVNEHRNIVVADVTTAVPIDDRQKDLIAARLGTRLGKTVVVETRVDASILGGVVAQVGDDVIDDSVRGRLERLRRALTA